MLADVTDDADEVFAELVNVVEDGGYPRPFDSQFEYDSFNRHPQAYGCKGRCYAGAHASVRLRLTVKRLRRIDGWTRLGTMQGSCVEIPSSNIAGRIPDCCSSALRSILRTSHVYR